MVQEVWYCEKAKILLAKKIKTEISEYDFFPIE